jgi:hypothetical protein
MLAHRAHCPAEQLNNNNGLAEARPTRAGEKGKTSFEGQHRV